MYGFIFGFQRLVWCPKCTPASRSSGTNSVVFAIRENELFGTPNSERGRCYRGGAKANRMLRAIRALQRRLCQAPTSSNRRLTQAPLQPARAGTLLGLSMTLRITGQEPAKVR